MKKEREMWQMRESKHVWVMRNHKLCRSCQQGWIYMRMCKRPACRKHFWRSTKQEIIKDALAGRLWARAQRRHYKLHPPTVTITIGPLARKTT